MIPILVKTLGIILVYLNAVADSNDGVDCPAGSVRKSVFEQSCAGKRWEAVRDPSLASEWCKKRLSVKCQPVRGPNEVEVDRRGRTSACKVLYVKECNRHGGLTRCRVRRRKSCGQPSGPAKKKASRTRQAFGADLPGEFGDDVTVSGMAAGRCRVRVRYLKKCRPDRDPKCVVVPAPETDCAEVADDPTEDGFDEDVELPSAPCVFFNTKKCHDGRCEIVPEKVCTHHKEADGKDQDQPDRETVAKEIPAQPEEPPYDDDYGYEKPDDYLEDEHPIHYDELNDVRDLEYIKHLPDRKREEVEKTACKLVKSCKSVPKRVCEKSPESGGNVYCKESPLEECEVSFENNNLEICHVVRDKICKPLPFVQPPSHGYDSELVCREVDVHVCSTEYEVEMASGTRSSCVQVPRVKCDRIPDRYGYRRHSKSCSQRNERICRQVGVVEPQPKRNDVCRTEKVKTCHYKGGEPAKIPELVICSESERNLCGMRQTKELVPDVCITDFYPFCHFSENSAETCRNVMQEECQMIEKC